MSEFDPPDHQDALPSVTLRIPGQWASAEALEEGLPEGYWIDDEHLNLPDGAPIQLGVMEADEEFPHVFIGACSRPLSPEDQEAIKNYTVNVILTGTGGSLEAARRLLKAGAAVIEAGGLGVFCDASGAAHGSEDWLALANDPEDGGPYWAFVTTTRDGDTFYTTGMHVLGHRDAILPATGNDEQDWFALNNFLGYSYRSGAVIADGDLLGDEDAPIFRVHAEPCTTFPPGTSFHNPYGVWRLEPAGDESSPEV